jgi:hypothetical protein
MFFDSSVIGYLCYALVGAFGECRWNFVKFDNWRADSKDGNSRAFELPRAESANKMSHWKSTIGSTWVHVEVTPPRRGIRALNRLKIVILLSGNLE